MEFPQIAAHLDSTVKTVLRTLHDHTASVVRRGGPPPHRTPDVDPRLTALYSDPEITALLGRHRIPPAAPTRRDAAGGRGACRINQPRPSGQFRGHQRAETLAISGQFRGRLWAVFHGRRQISSSPAKNLCGKIC